MAEAHPDRVVADAQGRLQFRQRGGGMFFDVGLELGGVELAPGTPTGLGRQGVGFDGGPIAVNRAPTHGKMPCRLGGGTARLNEFYHPFP